jgi:hypothetical protein
MSFCAKIDLLRNHSFPQPVELFLILKKHIILVGQGQPILKIIRRDKLFCQVQAKEEKQNVFLLNGEFFIT